MIYNKSLTHVIDHINAPELRSDIECAYKYVSEKINECSARLAEYEYNKKELVKDYEMLKGNPRELETFAQMRHY
jgi:hypothetical protein